MKKTLPWCSDNVNSWFKHLDRIHQEKTKVDEEVETTQSHAPESGREEPISPSSFAIRQNNNYISSEESEDVNDSDSDEETTTVFVKKTLPWRSDYVNSWFAQLDKMSKKRKHSGRRVVANSQPRSIRVLDTSSLAKGCGSLTHIHPWPIWIIG